MGKRKKSYYVQNAKKQRFTGGLVQPGAKGFLVTCANNEKSAVAEAYNILNEYADALYGPEASPSAATDAVDSSEDEEDISVALEKEVGLLQNKQKHKRRFQQARVNAKNCVFIRTQLNDPCELAHAILSSVYTRQKHTCRYLMRLLPVSVTCKAYLDDIKLAVGPLCEKVFKSKTYNNSAHSKNSAKCDSSSSANATPMDGERNLNMQPGNAASANTTSVELNTENMTSMNSPKTYAVVYKNRNNQLSRNDVIPAIAAVIKSINSDMKVDLNHPKYTVMVDILANICCLSIVKDYDKFRRYNLQEVASSKTVKKYVVASSKGISNTSTETMDNVPEVVSTNTVDKDELSSMTVVSDTSIRTEIYLPQAVSTNAGESDGSSLDPSSTKDASHDTTEKESKFQHKSLTQAGENGAPPSHEEINKTNTAVK